MDLTLHKFDLPLRHVFTISRGSTSVQETFIVQLSQDGQHGYGEATTNSYYGVSIESLQAALERVQGLLATHRLEDPAQLWEQVAPALHDQPFALCALDQAAHDLWGKLSGAPVYRLWGLEPQDAPLSNYTIGIDSIEKMVAKLRETPDWPIYKIKLGAEDDMAIVRAIRAETDAVIRVDANCGWTADQTIAYSRELVDLGVEFIEQPLPADDIEGSKLAYAESVLPIVADESCITEDDVDRCDGRFHAINIKLVKCGGMTPARRMIERARELGMKVMVGCMTESSVGISAIAQLAPLLDYVDMDGAALLAKDIATGVVVDRGRCRFPQENGNGCNLIAPAPLT